VVVEKERGEKKKERQMGWDGMEWSGMEWNGMEWNGMELEWKREIIERERREQQREENTEGKKKATRLKCRPTDSFLWFVCVCVSVHVRWEPDSDRRGGRTDVGSWDVDGVNAQHIGQRAILEVFFLCFFLCFFFFICGLIVFVAQRKGEERRKEGR